MELVLRRAVPDTIGPVEGAFLTDMFHQIADDRLPMICAKLLRLRMF